MKYSFKKELQQIMDMDVTDVASLPAMKRHITTLLRLRWRVTHRFVDDKCIQRASALGYASLLAIVPLVALGFSAFTSFQAFDTVTAHVQTTLLQNLLPTSQQVVLDYLGTVAEKSTALSVFGLIGLLFTSTALLNTMEEAFNHIWRITRDRTWFSKFIIFWLLLTLSPILIGASITITSYFTALPIIQDVAEGASMLGQIPFLLPWMISSIAMTALYMALPNTTVPFRFAIVGGLAAGALFEATKLGFAFYVTNLANYEKLYGALGTLPVFLIWLYLIWVVVLMGAEITFCLQHPEQSHKKNISLLKPGIRKFYAYLITLRAAQAMQQGKTLTLDAFIKETDIPENILQEWMDDLSNKGLLQPIADNSEHAWVPGRDASTLTLHNIHQTLNPSELEVPENWQQTVLGRTLSGLYFRLQREQHDVLENIKLRDLMDKEAQIHNAEAKRPA
ncbi:MAG: YihY family inner membrane protein [Mariprofundaceae bacterium]